MTTSAAIPPGRTVRTLLPASTRAPRQARQTIRAVLQSWGLATLASDAELIASELVANAAEHAPGTPIGLTIRQHHEPAGQHGIRCEITDTSPSPPQPRTPEPDSERGRGLQIVQALATASGITTTPPGKTAWFTLLQPPQPQPARQPEHQPEAAL